MKYLLLISMLVTVSAISFADESKIEDIKSSGSHLAPMPMSTVMNLRGRFDWAHIEDKALNVTTKNSDFATQYLRLVTDGKVTDSTKFSLILNPDFAATNINLIDTAIVTKKLNESLSVIVGKQWALVGGKENDYADYDLFLLSSFKSALPVASTPGLSLQFELAGQSLYLQALRGPAGTTSASTYGATYYGNFLDGKIAPIFSYHIEPTIRHDQKNQYLALGSQFLIANTILEFDWLKKSEEKNGISTKNLDTTSMVLNLRYNHERYKPFAKLILDKVENINSTVTETSRTGWEAGVEFYPIKDEDLHYHIVCNSADTKEKVGGSATTTESKVILGATFSFNILK